jgi:hypothetical protein
MADVLIALANTYGLLLVIFCMGHGLVSIPRRIWLESSLDESVKETERAAVGAWEAKADSVTNAGLCPTWWVFSSHVRM